MKDEQNKSELKDLLDAAKKEQEAYKLSQEKKPSFEEIVADAKRRAKEHNERARQDGENLGR